MSNFKVGDKVRVVNNGMDYPMYKDFIQSVLPGKSSLWESGRRIKEGNVYRVLAAHTHTTMPSYGMLYAVENLKKTEVYIIGESGLELVESPLPRICYLLGGENTPLEIGERFTVDDEKAMMREFVKAGFAWIARDKDDTLAVFTGKPKLVGYDDDTYMHNSGDDGCNIPDNLFPQITFERGGLRMNGEIISALINKIGELTLENIKLKLTLEHSIPVQMSGYPPESIIAIHKIRKELGL